MIERRVDETGLVNVRFRSRNANGSTRACVVGDFNGWEPDADRMERVGDGFVADLHLRPGAAYLLDRIYCENDLDADDDVANEYGGADSVIDLTHLTIASLAAAGDAPSQGR